MRSIADKGDRVRAPVLGMLRTGTIAFTRGFTLRRLSRSPGARERVL